MARIVRQLADGPFGWALQRKVANPPDCLIFSNYSFNIILKVHWHEKTAGSRNA